MAKPNATPTSSGSRVAMVATALRIPLTIICLVAIALATYYFVYVIDKRAYLVARNFRLLATIGHEIDDSIASDYQVLRSLLTTRKADNTLCGWLLTQPSAKECVARFLPVLRNADVIKWADMPNGDAELQLEF